MAGMMDHSDFKRMAGDSASGGSGTGRTPVLGDFELRQEIGRGGMGTVFEAWQGSLNRRVALKVLAHQVSVSANAVRRFQREAQAAAKLHHMHITPIFAQGQERGIYYYAMELVDGPSLAGVLTAAREGMEVAPAHQAAAETVVIRREGGGEGKSSAPASFPGEASNEARRQMSKDLAQSVGRPRELEQFAAVARHILSIADALEYAHRQGVVHRDIKPHNLLFGSDGHLRITDFGLARLSAEPGVTLTGEMVGSPLYMSPEQITEDRETIDHRTDIYSLGATLYEWLTGRPPFPGETRERVISQIANSDAAQPRTLCHEIPLALETICLKALERDRRRRYQTAGEFRDDLRRFLDSQPIRARRAGMGMRMQRFVARHPVAVLAAAAAMVAGSLSLALFRKQTEMEEATAQAVQAKQDFDRLLASAPFMVDGLPPELGGTLRMAEKVLPAVQNLIAGPDARGDQPSRETAGDASGSLRTPRGIARRASREFFESVATAAEETPNDELGKLLTLARDKRVSDPQAALQNVESYLLVRPRDYPAHLLGVALHAQRGDYDAMEADAETLLAIQRDDPKGYFWRALARFLRGEMEPSLADLALADQSPALTPWIQAVRALLLLQISQPAEAIRHLDEAIKHSPDMLAARLARAVAYGAVYANSGDPETIRKAVADLSGVIALEPKNAEALTMRGEFHGLLAEFASAASDFGSAIDVGGSSPELLAKWTFAKWAQSRMESAESASAAPPPSIEVRTTGNDSGSDVTTQSMQHWFSRFVYPPTQDGSGSGLAPSGPIAPLQSFAPLPSAPRTPALRSVDPSEGRAPSSTRSSVSEIKTQPAETKQSPSPEMIPEGPTSPSGANPEAPESREQRSMGNLSLLFPR